MRGAVILSFLAISFGLLLAACSDDDSGDSDGGEPTAMSTSDGSQPTSEATSDGSSSTGDNVDVALSGALDATWASGDDGVAANCAIFSGQLNASISGLIDSTAYALSVTQQTYTPGAFFLPQSNSDAATTPAAQITTSSDASLQWDMGLGIGDGSISLGGGSGGAPLLLTVDGDLTDKNGGDPVHVTADVTCTVTES